MRCIFKRLTLTGFALVGVSLSLSACHKDLSTLDLADTSVARDQAVETDNDLVAVAPIRKDGARAWAQNCMRCHNVRDPQERSDREWEIIVHHMRVRANLTATEHRLILEFLKAAN